MEQQSKTRNGGEVIGPWVDSARQGKTIPWLELDNWPYHVIVESMCNIDPFAYGRGTTVFINAFKMKTFWMVHLYARMLMQATKTRFVILYCDGDN